MRKKNKFVDVSAFTPGAINVFLNGPWVNFWCNDCGRNLAPRSIHDHWKKAHGGDPNNLSGLQNVAAEAVELFMKYKGGKGDAVEEDNDAVDGEEFDFETKTKRRNAMDVSLPGKKIKVEKVKTNTSGCSLFGPRVSVTEQKNPFFMAVDATPDTIKQIMTKDAWIDVMMKTKDMKHAQIQQGYNAIQSHFDH